MQMENPASPMSASRRRIFLSSNCARPSQNKATTNSGSVSIIIQFSAMPTPQIKVAICNQRNSRVARNFISPRRAAANNNTCSISPVAAVASRQKLNSRPQTTPAKIIGSFDRRVPSRPSGKSQSASSSVRASRPSVKAPHSAENKFSPGATQPTGSRRSGKVSSHSNG